MNQLLILPTFTLQKCRISADAFGDVKNANAVASKDFEYRFNGSRFNSMTGINRPMYSKFMLLNKDGR